MIFRTYEAWIKFLALPTVTLEGAWLMPPSRTAAQENLQQLCPPSYFLLKGLCKILWKRGEGLSPLYLLFFQMWSQTSQWPSFQVPMVFQIHPHQPLAVVVEMTDPTQLWVIRTRNGWLISESQNARSQNEDKWSLLAPPNTAFKIILEIFEEPFSGETSYPWSAS